MTLVRAPVLHCRDSTTASRLSPGLRRGPPAPLAGADARLLETLHTRAAEVPRGATEGAVSDCAQRQVPRLTFPEGKVPRRSGLDPSSPTGLGAHAYSARRQLEAVTSAHEERTGRIEARCRREATGEALPTRPEGGRRYWSLPLPKERRICSVVVRIPGPDDSGRSGADTQRIDLGGSRALRHPSVTLRRRRDESQRLATAWCRGDLASWHPRKGAVATNGAGIGREASTGTARPCGARCRSFDRGRCRLQSP